MKHIIDKHKAHWSDKTFSGSAIIAFLLLGASLCINYYANIYTTNHAGNYVADIILDNIPVVNVDAVFFEGFAALWLFIILLLVREPKQIPFVIKSIAIFILIRSVFITLTHLGMPPLHSYFHSYLDDDSSFTFFTSGNDMFFSSHTGLPFLMALIYWENKRLRYFFIGASLIFGASVLLGHLHYSIDVFAAYFITYSIFHICVRLLPKDYKMLMSTQNNGK